MKNALLSILGLCLLTGCAISKKSVQVAVNGKPNAEIVVAKDAHEAVKLAGEELGKWIEAISGAKLPVVEQSSGKIPAIRLAVNPECFSEDLKTIGETDGYAVRPCPRCKGMVIFGTRPKGVLNGVFKMLQRNTDIIWARPNDEFGTCFSKNPNLRLKDIDYLDVPVYIVRGWQITDRHHDINSLWQMRNGMNWTSATIGFSEDTVKYDPVREFGGGHNLCGIYIRENKYYKNHPEFYPLVGGKRLRHSKSRGGCQLCFTNKEMTKCFIQEIDDHFKKCPNYDTYRIMIEDNYNLCECDECLKPIKLDDGTVVTKDDEAFRSTQFFLWLNPIARYIKQKYNKQVLSFAYFFTEIPPKCKVEDNISLSLCPIYKNSKHDICAPENLPSFKRMDGWLNITPNVTWREYYGLCYAFPRPIDMVAASDWRYANSRGVRRTYSEMYPDGVQDIKTDSWDINAMYFWVMTQCAWNPYLDVKKLRDTFLTRVFGPAANDIRQFYAIIEDSWNALPGDSRWNDRCRGNWASYVVKPNKVDECRKALDRAATHNLTPKAITMLKRLRTVFDASTASITFEVMTSAKAAKAPAFDPTFSTGDWAHTQASTNFLNHTGKRQEGKTTVRILHDDKAFYVGAVCENPYFEKLTNLHPQGAKRDTWLNGEKMECFFSGLDDNGKAVSFQFVVNPYGNIYDGRGGDASWDGNFTPTIDRRANGWSIMLTIPYKALGYKSFPKNVKTSFMRYFSKDNDSCEVGYWNDMAPHNIAYYTDLILK